MASLAALFGGVPIDGGSSAVEATVPGSDFLSQNRQIREF